MTTSATGKGNPGATGACGGFSLVELLTVVAIMAVVMGLVAVGVSGMQRPGLQTAAAQVSSGMSLARQLAITRNTTSAFIVATTTNDAWMPAEPFKYWSVASSNRGLNTWTLRKDWEKLPDGAVFLESLGGAPTGSYRPINSNPFPPSVTVGQPSTPASFANAIPFTVRAGASLISFPASPAVFFNSDGSADNAAGAVRLGDGADNASGQVILRSTNRYYFVETDATVGRIRVRAPESYR
jgi:prepilin-type N-terminal cleavage/methylation domain-containing protein